MENDEQYGENSRRRIKLLQKQIETEAEDERISKLYETNPEYY